MSQRQLVLNTIREQGSITRASAAKLYIFELSSRILDLERIGDDTKDANGNPAPRRWRFKKTPLKGKRPDGSRWRVIRYSDPVELA